jgi:lysophospholipid acyltransferase
MIWTLDVSGTQMLITIKLTSFAFDYADSFLNQNNDTLTKSMELPSFLSWLGYVYFFPSFLTGPVVSYKQYSRFTNDPKDLPPNNLDITSKALTVVGTSFLYVIGMYFGRYFPVVYMTTQEFTTRNTFLYRLLYASICIFIIRCKFYFAWTFSYACFIACGITTDSNVNNTNDANNNAIVIDTANSPDFGINVKPLEIELAQNIYQITNNWNMCTNEWLKEHIYKRAITLKYSKQQSTYITNTVAALWHGFYPGYLLTFLFGGTVTELGRRIRTNIRPYFVNSYYVKMLYDVLCIITMWILMPYLGLPFQLYSFGMSMSAWYNMYFIGHVILLISVVMLYVIPQPLPEQMHTKTE